MDIGISSRRMIEEVSDSLRLFVSQNQPPEATNVYVNLYKKRRELSLVESRITCIWDIQELRRSSSV